jgi:radical SAM protein (TIGR01212 family)
MFNVPPRSRYNAYSRFIKDKFGCRVYKVSVDAGFSCPNRDGTIANNGCVYCSNDSFRPKTAARLKPISEQISEGMEFLRRRNRAEKFVIYFQPFTNTHAPLEKLIPLYETALNHRDVVGISIGTRPDCIDEEKISWLEKAAAVHFVTLEYGLQSIYDTTLARICRGHNFQCWLDAMQRTRGRGIWLCTHLILGFPWETREEMLREAEVISDKGLNFIKLHHLHVVHNTSLEDKYHAKPFALLGLEEYANLVADFLANLSPDIYVERLFGTAPKDQLIGPVWGKSKAEIQRTIEQKLISRDIWQGKNKSPLIAASQ